MAIVAEETVPAGKPWSAIVKRGQRLRIVDIEGEQGVDFLCYAAANPEERYHAANTLKRSKTLLLTTGHVLYSDAARPLMTIVDDTCGVHDTIGGCCSAPSNEMLYGAGTRRAAARTSWPNSPNTAWAAATSSPT